MKGVTVVTLQTLNACVRINAFNALCINCLTNIRRSNTSVNVFFVQYTNYIHEIGHKNTAHFELRELIFTEKVVT